MKLKHTKKGLGLGGVLALVLRVRIMVRIGVMVSKIYRVGW